MEKINGFQKMKDFLLSIQEKEILSRKSVISHMQNVLAETTIDNNLRKYRACGYFLPVITKKEGLCNGLYIRTTKEIPTKLNSTTLEEEYYDIMSKELLLEFGSQWSSNYMEISNFIKFRNKFHKNCLTVFNFNETLIDFLVEVGFISVDDDYFVVNLTSNWNISNTAIFDLYANKELIPKNYLFESKSVLPIK